MRHLSTAAVALLAGFALWTSSLAATEPPAPATPVAPAEPSAPAKAAEPDPAFVLGFTVKDIDGKDTDLAQFKGKVLLVVNSASECGYTPQYEGLQKLYSEQKDKGLVVIVFPANNFRGQEPGSNETIKQFCATKFGVTFPLMAKVSVKGDDIAPFYKKLAEQPAPIGGPVKWNFTKYLVDKQGRVVARYESKITPEDADLNKRIAELLAAK